MADEKISSNATPVDYEKLVEMMSQSMIALDGLWFLNVLKELGPEKTLAIDVKAIGSQFKYTTRLWRKLMNLDSKSVEDKRQVFEAIARFYGHKFEVLKQEKHVTMRLRQCGIYENLKKAGRDHHDCTVLCKKIAPEWFAEIEPRTGGKGNVDLQLPQGGEFCDWSVEQPD